MIYYDRGCIYNVFLFLHFQKKDTKKKRFSAVRMMLVWGRAKQRKNDRKITNGKNGAQSISVHVMILRMLMLHTVVRRLNSF